MEIKIGNKKVGGGNPVFMIAELSANHNHDFEIAVQTIKAAAKAGADAIKLQTYTPDTMTINCNNKYFKISHGTLWDGKTLYELYKEAMTPWEWQPKLKKIAEKEGLICFSTPFDKSSVDFLEDMNVPAYKIASFEIFDIELIEYVAKKQKPIIISTGMATKEDIKLAINTCRKAGNNKIILLKCTSAYPTRAEDSNVKTIIDMKHRFGKIIGISDHTEGITVPIAAVALGAKIVEKHFILDKKIGGPDADFSMEPKEFQSMVESIRTTEKALGKVSYKSTEEVRKNKQFARSLFVVKDIKKGEKFTSANIKCIRPGYGLHPKYYVEEVIGKTARRNIKMGNPLKWNLIK